MEKKGAGDFFLYTSFPFNIGLSTPIIKLMFPPPG